MLIAARNGFLAGKRLPYDAEVEYLESTGTQWIDTGVMASGDLNFTFTAYASTRGASLCGAAREFFVDSLFCYIGNNLTLYGVYCDSQTTLLPGGLNRWLTVSKTNDAWIVNGETKATAAKVFSSDTSFALFCRKSGNSTSGIGSGTKFAVCEIWSNLNLVRDFIPVRKGTVGYLYDRVSGKIFGNAGTGDFVIGPDK